MEKLNEVSTLMFKEYPDCVSVFELQQMLGIKRTKAYELLKNGTTNQSKLARTTKFQN